MDQLMMMLRCPNCLHFVIIEQINCGIFRHGVLPNGQQLPPHASREECARAVSGCGKPFQVVKTESGGFVAKRCGFI
jgi:hypothetical protein